MGLHGLTDGSEPSIVSPCAGYKRRSAGLSPNRRNPAAVFAVSIVDGWGMGNQPSGLSNQNCPALVGHVITNPKSFKDTRDEGWRVSVQNQLMQNNAKQQNVNSQTGRFASHPWSSLATLAGSAEARSNTILAVSAPLERSMEEVAVYLRSSIASGWRPLLVTRSYERS